MKHISKLILNNFQQWKTGLIKFKPGLNILIGNTESGKSTLFRAIGSILTGKMSEDYIRKGTKGCEVEIQFSDERALIDDILFLNFIKFEQKRNLEAKFNLVMEVFLSEVEIKKII